MHLLVYDSHSFYMPSYVITSLNTIYQQCFGMSIKKSHYNNLSDEPYMLYFVLLEDTRVQAFCKIIFMPTAYELFDVCRRDPHLQKHGMMTRFLTQSIHYFRKKYWKDKKPLLLAIREENNYKHMAQKLYEKCGFIQTTSTTTCTQKITYQETKETDVFMHLVANQT